MFCIALVQWMLECLQGHSWCQIWGSLRGGSQPSSSATKLRSIDRTSVVEDGMWWLSFGFRITITFNTTGSMGLSPSWLSWPSPCPFLSSRSSLETCMSGAALGRREWPQETFEFLHFLVEILGFGWRPEPTKGWWLPPLFSLKGRWKLIFAKRGGIVYLIQYFYTGWLNQTIFRFKVWTMFFQTMSLYKAPGSLLGMNHGTPHPGEANGHVDATVVEQVHQGWHWHVVGTTVWIDY